MKNILVFPCGSEIGLEIHRSMKYSSHFKLIGASSVPDHGRFIYNAYVEGLPFHDSPHFISEIKRVVLEFSIDAIFPAMDSVAVTLKENEDILGIPIITSPLETCRICASKKQTYKTLDNLIPLPLWSDQLDTVTDFPIFIKPDIGYGSRNVHLAPNHFSAKTFIEGKGLTNKFIFCEYLPGKEFTIDCFTNSQRKLLFIGPRVRSRISNGISVNTKECFEYFSLFKKYAHIINDTMVFRGSWFFQMKEDKAGNPKLLEVAARLGGSSSLFRNKGVNFALLSAFDCFNYDVSVLVNDYTIELDRALSNRYKINIDFSNIYVDFDDCLVIDGILNHELVSFLYKSIGENKKIFLLTKHAGDIHANLKAYRLQELFDQIIHIDASEDKTRYISSNKSIFIDDSYAERKKVKEVLNIPVFSPDMVESLF